jgi:putative ATP-binding cassette transporter
VTHILLKNLKKSLFIATIVGFLSGLSSTALIILIDFLLNPRPALSLPKEFMGMLFIGLGGVFVISKIVTMSLLVRLGQTTIFRMRMQLSHLILSVPLRRLQRLGSARLLVILTEDVKAIAEACEWMPAIAVNSALVLSCLAYLGWLSWTVLALVSGLMLLGIGSFLLFERKALKYLSQARNNSDALYQHFRGLLDGIKELKLNQLRRQAFLSDVLAVTAADYRKHYSAGMSTYIVASNWGGGLFYLAIGGIIFLIPHWFVTPPEIIAGSTLVVLFMMGPLTVIMDGLPIVGRGKVAYKKVIAINEELAQLTQEPALLRSGLQTQQVSSISLQKVVHRYQRDLQGFTVGPVDLTLQAGEVVFIIGGNGSGKTSLAMLLVGLYHPEQGQILLNGRRVTDKNREHYRQCFSALFSDFYLFESLLGFNKTELDAQAREYLLRLQLDHKVSIENGVFSTLELSQGQRKRLALLVAYLEDRSCYLFDEWAADQDPIFKNIFYTEIIPALKARGKIVIVISHDDHYFHLADRCLKLDEGQLREMPVQ